MKILHISAECYPAAKAGGLGDVVGALPKYLTAAGYPTGVVIPKYGLKWIHERTYEEVFRGVVRMHNTYLPFLIQKEVSDELGFAFFVVEIPGKFDRPGIYNDPGGWGYDDDISRWLAFQQAVLIWLAHDSNYNPEVLHCHDHHTGLIPFFVKHVPEFKSLAHIPTVYTIHNGLYQGNYGWEQMYLLPFFDASQRGLIDWKESINPMAAGIKNCWRLTTVSPGYLDELRESSLGLENLFWYEQQKSIGILNGIDTKVWDPKTDPRVIHHFNGKDIKGFKLKNKQELAKRFNIDLDYPLITFIGRLVNQKGADLIPDLVGRLVHSGLKASFVVLGTGEQELHRTFEHMSHQYFNFFDTSLEYNETLAHQLYAGSDFLFMPSRVEPCGLNQMYACRYGSIPMVRSVGGLKDSIPDIGNPDGSGRGIRFDQFTVEDAFMATYRAIQLFNDKKALQQIRKRIMNYDFSWENSVNKYINIYEELVLSAGKSLKVEKVKKKGK